MSIKIVCHNCKTVLGPGSTYCPHCGARITGADYVPEETVLLNPIYLSPGTVLHMKYRINGVIGQGGFGITYDGTDIKLDMHVAIKEYFPNPMASRQVSISNEVTCSSNTTSLYEQGMSNFLKEARNMAKFAGEPDFVSVHDYFSENNTAYIIMEFVEGQNLKQYMQRYGRLTLSQAMPIIMPVMNALEKIHAKNMIHRDVSPSNIMILNDGRVRLLDFGAAKEVSLETQRMTTMSAVYKMGYSPLEQLTRDMNQGPYSDIYALCATIYEMLTGSTPPSPLNRLSGSAELIPPSRLGVNISPSQEAALLKGLAVKPSDRIQTISELRNSMCGIGTAGIQRFEGGTRFEGDTLFGSVDEGIPDTGNILKVVLIGAVSILILALIGMVISNSSLNSGKHGTTQKSNEQQETAAEPEADTGQETADPGQETADADEKNENGEESEVPAEEESEEQEEVHITPDDDESENREEDTNTDEETEEQYEIPDGVFSFSGHHYYIYEDANSWEEAMDYCKERGGYVAVINDSDENEALYDYMVSEGYDIAYFGLIDPDGDQNWQYIYGDTSDYRNWGINSKGVEEPNNADDNEIHAELDAHMYEGHWNDSRFGKQVYTPEGEEYREKYTYICEWDE